MGRCPGDSASPPPPPPPTPPSPPLRGGPATATPPDRRPLSFPPKSETMVVLFARQAGGSWLAFDTYCGNPQNRLGAKGATSCIQ